MANRSLSPASKCCKRCAVKKPATDFYKYRWVCKSCHTARATQHQKSNLDSHRKSSAAFYGRNAERLRLCSLKYKEENRDKVLASARKTSRKRRLKVIGITEADLLTALNSQGGHCAICKTKEVHLNGGRMVHIDHCHQTGLFRGILCAGCNTGLGKFGDSAEMLLRAASYLGGKI